ncbi:MAG: hypothetical protein AAFQ22_07140 [Pseudomonadota bacterium]
MPQPWENDPVVEGPAAPWESDPVVQPANSQRPAAFDVTAGMDGSTGGLDGMASFADRASNVMTLGNAHRVNAALSNIGVGGGARRAAGDEQQTDLENDYRRELMEAAPIAGTAGDVFGFATTIAPAGFAAAGRAGTAIAPAVQRLIPQGTSALARGGRYGMRLLGLGAIGATENALYQGLVEGNNTATLEDRDVGLGERLDMAKDGAQDPFAWAALPLMSGIYRSLRYLRQGSPTPDDVQLRVAANQGVAPANPDLVLETGQDGADPRSMRLATNMVMDAMRQTGLSRAEASDGVAAGFQRIADSLLSNADGRTPFAMIVEREFAQEFGQEIGEKIARNFRMFLMKADQDGAAAVREGVRDIRSGSAEDVRQSLQENFGSQPIDEARDANAQSLQKIGQYYNEGTDRVPGVLARPDPNSSAAQSVKDFLTQRPNIHRELLDAESFPTANQGGGEDRQTVAQMFVDQFPYQALHHYRTKIADYVRSGTNLDVNQPLLREIDSYLDEVPGYPELRAAYRDEAQVRQNLGQIRTGPDGTLSYVPGFGDEMRRAAPRASQTQALAEQFEGMSPRQQQAAALSAREVFSDMMRGLRRQGTDQEGNDVLGFRLGQAQSDGMYDAIRSIFNERGEAVTDTFDDVYNRRQFATDIDSRANSTTFNKAQAANEGADSMSPNWLTRQATSGANNGTLADVMLMAQGVPPIFTGARMGGRVLAALLGPGRARREDVARLLMDVPQRTTPTPPASDPIPALTGSNVPRGYARQELPAEMQAPVALPEEPVRRSGPGGGGDTRLERLGDAAAIAGIATAGVDAEAQTAPENGELTSQIETANSRVLGIEENIAQLEADRRLLDDPNADPKDIQRTLERRGFDLGPAGVDGNIGPDTRAAIRANKAEIDNQLERQRAARTPAEARLRELEERAVYADADAEGGFLRDAAPYIGAGLGIAAAYGSRRSRRRSSQKEADAVETDANSRLNQNEVSDTRYGTDSIDTRAANLNDFWRLGGATDEALPFTQNEAGEWIANPDAANLSDLYPNGGERFRAPDIAWAASGAGESVLAGQLKEGLDEDIADAQQELERYQEAGDLAGQERTLARINRLENLRALAYAAERGGQLFAAGTGAAALKSRYAQARPDMAAADWERSQIAQSLTQRAGQNAPTPPAPETPQIAGPSRPEAREVSPGVFAPTDDRAAYNFAQPVYRDVDFEKLAEQGKTFDEELRELGGISLPASTPRPARAQSAQSRNLVVVAATPEESATAFGRTPTGRAPARSPAEGTESAQRRPLQLVVRQGPTAEPIRVDPLSDKSADIEAEVSRRLRDGASRVPVIIPTHTTKQGVRVEARTFYVVLREDLRSPEAAFNPSERGNPGVMAGVPAGIAAATVLGTSLRDNERPKNSQRPN